MPFSKKCQRYFNKRNHKIKSLLEKTGRGYEKEDYHDLRLEIKKVKAFAAMLAHVADLKEEKYLKSYRRIFKMAGRVRDAQMASALLEKQRPLKWLQQYRHELVTETQLHEKEFYLAADEKLRNKVKKTAQKVKPYLGTIKKENARKFLDKEKRKVKEIVGSSRISIEDAHEMRKQLKTIGYTAKLLGIKNSVSSQVEQIQEALGEWHDHRQLAERLKKDAAGVKDKQRKMHMHHLEKALNKKAAGMFTVIGKSLRSMHEAAWKSPAKGEALLL
jgi:CHAD domain-containing protein